MQNQRAWIRHLVVCSLTGAASLLFLALPVAQAQEEAAAAVTPEPAAAPEAEAPAAPAAEAAPEAEAAEAPAAEAAVPAAAEAPKPEVAEPATAPAAAETVAPAMGEPTAAASVVEQESQRERIQREEQRLKAQQLETEAAKALRAGQYKDALEKYAQADAAWSKVSSSDKAVLARHGKIVEAKGDVYAAWADDLERQGEKFADEGKYDEAIRRCDEAAKANPKMQTEMDARIKEMFAAKRDIKFRAATAEAYIDPEKPERETSLETMVEQGKVLMANRRYSDARDMFERVLLRDPYHPTATRALRQLYVKMEEAGDARRETTIKERMAKTRWSWVEPVPVPRAQPEGPGLEGVGKLSGIRAKLQTIIVPSLEFEEATIPQVVAYLRKMSKDYDKETGEGVNIIFHQETAPAGTAPGLEPAAPAPAPEFGAEPGVGFGELEPAPAPAAMAALPPVTSRTVTMSITNVPLGSALQYVCQAAGLKYRIETHAVVIADKSVELDPMETRFFPIEPGVIEVFAQKTTATGLGGLGGEAAQEVGGGGGEGMVNDSARLMGFFSGMGVEFPRGASVSFNPRTSKLVVRNTPEQLRKFEDLMLEVNTPTPQVTIEAKFVEVSMKNLDMFGFQWTLNNNIGSSSVPGSAIDPITGNPVLVPFAETGKLIRGTTTGVMNPSTITSGLRSATTGLGLPTSLATSILNGRAIIGDADFSVVMDALSQSGSADILSAPKVTTISGKTAVLRKAKRQRFVSSWENPDVNVGGGTGTGTTVVELPAAEPQFDDEATDVGVILTVTPVVGADKYSISLELKPEVREFLGYDTSLNSPRRINSETGAVESEWLYNMPIFDERTVETNVIVWDGETVVLGGFIGERETTYKDKVPLLGDLPLIGRLFHSSGKNKEKYNLLIFVTPRLVYPSGLPMRSSEVRGIPDFRY
jgi:general secretion pathway protein D